MNIKKAVLFILVLFLIITALLTSLSFALWSKDTEVRFILTISEPDEEFEWPLYDTVPEGIEVISGDIYDYIDNRMDIFDLRLEDRIEELNNLPFGDITVQELQQECNYYRNVVIAGIGDYIREYARYINGLAAFYNNLPQEEKNKIPDFWDQFDALWEYHDQLWLMRDRLYDLVDEVWEAGESKVNYNN